MNLLRYSGRAGQGPERPFRYFQLLSDRREDWNSGESGTFFGGSFKKQHSDGGSFNTDIMHLELLFTESY